MSDKPVNSLPSSENPVPVPNDSQPFGRDLTRQISVQLTNQQFERLYLQPGGVGAPRQEDFTKRFGNPTPLGLAAFCICLSPMTCYLMGFMGASGASMAVVAGPYLFTGGIGLYIACIMEWIIGNTFPSVVFAAYGGFTLSIGYLNSPSQGIAQALGITSVEYNGGLSLWFVFWAVLTFVFMISALRTNIVFIGLFLFLDLLYIFLAAGYSNLANGNVAQAGRILTAAGALGFVSAMCGWYLLLSVMLAINGLPTIPVGDMSSFMSRDMSRRGGTSRV